jgi:hypothetical protein
MMRIDRKLMVQIGAALIAAAAINPAVAGNTPCSQSKGGIVGCENGRFLCRDGSISASKKRCGASDAPSQTAPKARATQPKSGTAPKQGK